VPRGTAPQWRLFIPTPWARSPRPHAQLRAAPPLLAPLDPLTRNMLASISTKPQAHGAYDFVLCRCTAVWRHSSRARCIRRPPQVGPPRCLFRLTFFAFTDPASPHTASATRLPTPRQGRHRPGCQCGHHSCVGRRCMGRDLDSFTRRADACAATLIRMPQAASQAKSSQVKSSQDESSQRQDTLIRNAASSTFMAAAACLVARAAVLGLWLRASARPPMTTTAPMTSAGLHLPTSGGAAAAFSP